MPEPLGDAVGLDHEPNPALYQLLLVGVSGGPLHEVDPVAIDDPGRQEVLGPTWTSRPTGPPPAP